MKTTFKHLGLLCAIIVFAWLPQNTWGQEAEKNPFQLGFKTLQIQNDFGLGVELVTPYFISDKMAFKIGYQLHWLEYLNGSQITWKTYNSWQLGVKRRRPVLEQKLFVTAEGGALFILPNDAFSSQDSDLVIYGLLGIDWVTTDQLTLFMEFGAGGSKTRANKVAASPIFSNGFISQVGLRIRL